MKDYIFIIIAIVLSILGAVNKSKKKKLQQMEYDEPKERQPSIFDQFFDDPMFEESKPEPMPAEPQTGRMELQEMEPLQELKVPKMERPRLSRLERPKMERTPLTRMERTPLTRMERTPLTTMKPEESPKKMMATELMEKDKPVERSYTSIMNEFSLKKAVVFSEIINRKY